MKNVKLLIENLDTAIRFHRLKKEDPHGISNAVICALTEVRDAIGLAELGKRTPETTNSP